LTRSDDDIPPNGYERRARRVQQRRRADCPDLPRLAKRSRWARDHLSLYERCWVERDSGNRETLAHRIFDLNDPSELRHGFHQAIKIWNSKAFYGCAEADEIGAVLGDFNNEKLRESAHYFTCSFSSDGDELGQWRSYADNGRGYSLGFDRQALEAAFIQKGSSAFAQTFPVQYDDDLLADLQGQIIERALPLTSLPTGKDKDLPDPTIKVLKLKLLVSVASHTLHTALFFKHAAYRNEQEYRFLEMFPANKSPTDVKLRTRPYSLVRYREFDWRANASGALQEIVVGPAADRDKAHQFARDCLRMYHKEDIEVIQSPIPYRAL
jgi:hypothetical protein